MAPPPPPPPEDHHSTNKRADPAGEQPPPEDAAEATTPPPPRAPRPPPTAEEVAYAAARLQEAFEQRPMMAAPARGKGKRKGGEIMDVPSGETKCTVCGKKFATWKAVFGHMRVHSDRPFRGAFPPPVGADWTPAASSAAANDEPQGIIRQEPRLGFAFDLNVPYVPRLDDVDDGVVGGEVPAGKRVRILDLNRNVGSSSSSSSPSSNEAAAKRDDGQEEEEEAKRDDEDEEGGEKKEE